MKVYLKMYNSWVTGMISRVLFPNEVACANATECEKICQNPEGCSNIAYPLLVLDILPPGIRPTILHRGQSAECSVIISTNTAGAYYSHRCKRHYGSCDAGGVDEFTDFDLQQHKHDIYFRCLAAPAETSVRQRTTYRRKVRVHS